MTLTLMLNLDRPAFEKNASSASRVAVLKDSASPVVDFQRLAAFRQIFAWTLLGHLLHKKAFAQRGQLQLVRALNQLQICSNAQYIRKA
ncbi:MAG TPA: hypothetical protein VGM58_03925 [Verrucomicrobiae bacterium]